MEDFSTYLLNECWIKLLISALMHICIYLFLNNSSHVVNVHCREFGELKEKEEIKLSHNPFIKYFIKHILVAAQWVYTCSTFRLFPHFPYYK